MRRNVRIAAVCTLIVVSLVAMVLGSAYYAARQVRPFYRQALQIEPEALERGSRELESRATALYSDARQLGQWQALFTAEQINGWLATQLAANQQSALPTNIRDPRVAIEPERLTLGFRTFSGGVDTVVSVDAGVELTEEGAVAIQFFSVRAGALPLPVMQLADEIAAACQDLKLPVRWTQQDGRPVAIVELHTDAGDSKREFFIDSIELGKNELYVAGHTEAGMASRESRQSARRSSKPLGRFSLDDYELRLTATDGRSALKIGRRSAQKPPAQAAAATH
jgi:hypothetical protein